MTATESTGAEWPEYRVTAKGLGANPENKIHTDEVARTLGFSGGLVGGTTVYAYMTHPLVERLGEAWFSRGRAELTLFKPAYNGDLLNIRVLGNPRGEGQGSIVVRAMNEQGLELARLETRTGAILPPPDPRAAIEAPSKPHGAEKPLVSWDGIVPGDPFWAMPWNPGEKENREWTDGVGEVLPLYQGGEGAPLHPGLVLQAANNVFKENFLLPAWIHVASQITFREVLRVGQPLEVRALPVEKYEKKAHHFVDLYVAMLSGGNLALEVRHKAIFKVAERA